MLKEACVACRIACDYCGQYPIVGKRWQCLECLERVGFDLCAACYERRADVVGRFNQHHKAGVVPVLCSTHHCLQDHAGSAFLRQGLLKVVTSTSLGLTGFALHVQSTG